MKFFASFFVLLIFVSVNSTLTGQTRQRATVSVYPRSEVADDLVKIEDIAKVYCLDKSLREKIENLDIEKLSKNRQTISANQIRIRIRLADLQDIKVIGATETQVHKRAVNTVRQADSKISEVDANVRYLAASKIKKLLSDFYQVPLSWVAVEPLKLTPTPKAVAGELGVELMDSPKDLIGRRLTRIVVTADGKPAFKTQLSANIFVSKNVLVVHSDKRANEQILESDYRIEKKMFDSQKINDVVGQWNSQMITRRALRRGSIISTRDLKIQKNSVRPVVASNDVVTVVAQKGNIRVTLAGAISLDNGKVGDSIRLRNPKTNKIIRAKVISPTEIRAIY